MTTTPFDKILILNHVFGTLDAQAPKAHPDNADLAKAYALVREETGELMRAESRVDVIDGVADTLVVADGMLARLGYDANSVADTLGALQADMRELGAITDYIQSRERVIELLLNIKARALLTAHTIGADSLLAFNIVHENNMSKLCPTEADADATISRYASQGIHVNKYRAGDFWCVRAGGPRDKFLKNHNWVPPDLSAL